MRDRKRGKRVFAYLCATTIVFVALRPAGAMHIAEGILPLSWAAVWFIAMMPFMYLGLRELRLKSAANPHHRALTGLVGAAVFVFSCLPIPVPIAGTSSHPVGTGLAAILIGPAQTSVISSIALLLQALFLAHGGLSTLGANVISMGVAGAFGGYAVFHMSRRLGASFFVSAFLAGLASDWFTYAMTSLELSLALNKGGSFISLFLTIIAAFMPTQVPLAILEGLMAGGAIEFIRSRRPDLISNMLEAKPG